MLYLYLDTNEIKLLSLKKSLLGQYDASYFSKKHEVELLTAGRIINIDLIASAIKEALTFASNNHKEREVTLILPQQAFEFLRIEVPADIAQPAVNSFLKDKIRATLKISSDDSHCDYLLKENSARREILFYSLDKEALRKYQESLNLLDLKLEVVVPAALAYYKLFEKTLRKEKKEKIFYVHYQKNLLIGYLYDSLGSINKDTWQKKVSSTDKFELILKEKIKEYSSQDIKLNRLIISGNESENIRQDTFTKTIGVWTNLLKRIIPNFYQEYLKMIIVEKNQPLPFLDLDVCLGAFIFSQEEKNFNLLKKNILSPHGISLSAKKIKLPLKEIGIFVLSFILSFFIFSLISKQKVQINPNFFQANKITTTPTTAPQPTARPTPTIVKESIKIKVLNGSGIPGKAQAAKELLKKRGYQEILTGNAEEFNYETTEIQVKNTQSSLADTIKNDIQDYTSSIKQSDLEADENADVIIIIGKDFK